MLYFVILTIAVSVAAAARLDTTVLLPPFASSSGGADAGIEAPHFSEQYNHLNEQHNHLNEQHRAEAPLERRHPSAAAETLSYENVMNEDGYHYAYETSDGTKVEQTGRSYPGAKPEEGTLVVTGSYSYIGDDGQEYTITYTADENGYRAEGAHLPTPPPIPAAILNSLQLTDRSRGQYDSNKSSYDADAGL